MSNPPFTSPLLEEDDDLFSFPPNLDPNNSNTTPPNPILNQEINPLLLPTISLPMLDYYQDLSLFLDDHNQEEDFGSIGQILPTTSDWVAQLEHVGIDPLLQGPIDRDDHQAGGASSSGVGEGEGSPSIKKLAHNAKERVRRLKLNDIYVALRSLLPESKRPKEKWSAPYMIDRALEYTPRLQAEVEKLTLEKTNLLSVLAKKKALIRTSDKTDDDQVEAVNKDKQKSLTVSINEVKRGEVIIQICQQIFNNVECCLSTLIEKLEDQGMNVVGASTLRACQDRQCFHLHLQMGDIPLEDTNYIGNLHKRLVSWLS